MITLIQALKAQTAALYAFEHAQRPYSSLLSKTTRIFNAETEKLETVAPSEFVPSEVIYKRVSDMRYELHALYGNAVCKITRR